MSTSDLKELMGSIQDKKSKFEGFLKNETQSLEARQTNIRLSLTVFKVSIEPFDALEKSMYEKLLTISTLEKSEIALIDQYYDVYKSNLRVMFDCYTSTSSGLYDLKAAKKILNWVYDLRFSELKNFMIQKLNACYHAEATKVIEAKVIEFPDLKSAVYAMKIVTFEGYNVTSQIMSLIGTLSQTIFEGHRYQDAEYIKSIDMLTAFYLKTSDDINQLAWNYVSYAVDAHKAHGQVGSDFFLGVLKRVCPRLDPKLTIELQDTFQSWLKD